MTAATFQDLIYFDSLSATPKFRQFANAIVSAIEEQKLGANDPLPSINDVRCRFDVCRETVEKGYHYLKTQGIVDSAPGKGYFVKRDEVTGTKKVLLLFNKLSQHKKIIYDAIVSTLGKEAIVDLYVYNNDLRLFRRLLNNCRGDYHHYVVLPHFIEGGETAHHLINTLPKEKLVLLDKVLPGIKGTFGAVYERFEEDIYKALQLAAIPLQKYHTLKLVFPEHSYYPKEIIKGFVSFCTDYAFDYKIIHQPALEEINPGEVFLTLQDDDLVLLAERLVALHLQAGVDVGIISYNETPFKRIILNGITTISTDFRAMGVETAKMILENVQRQVPVPFTLALRSSL